MFEAEQVEKGKVLAILMYVFPILFFLPLVSAENKTEYMMFHANQALLLFILEIIASATAAIIIGFFVGVFALVCAILGIVSAVNGTDKPLPLIGKIKLLK